MAFSDETSSSDAGVMLTSASNSNLISHVNVTSDPGACPAKYELSYSAGVTVAIATVVALLSLVTMGGNLLVAMAFKIDRRLQTIANCFLLSLALADFSIGLVSMPLFSVYTCCWVAAGPSGPSSPAISGCPSITR